MGLGVRRLLYLEAVFLSLVMSVALFSTWFSIHGKLSSSCSSIEGFSNGVYDIDINTVDELALPEFNAMCMMAVGRAFMESSVATITLAFEVLYVVAWPDSAPVWTARIRRSLLSSSLAIAVAAVLAHTGAVYYAETTPPPVGDVLQLMAAELSSATLLAAAGYHASAAAGLLAGARGERG